MDRKNSPPALFPTDNDSFISDTDIMRSYAIDTLVDSEYYIGNTEEIETTEALQAPDSEQFITATKKEVHSLISETMTLQPITRKPGGRYVEKSDNNGKFAQPSSANEKRCPTENQTSARSGQLQKAPRYAGR
jgi:hypothetical protein